MTLPKLSPREVTMAERLSVIHFGLGAIGTELARAVASRRTMEIVGAVDVDPTKVGKDVGEIVDVGRRLGVQVTADLNKVLQDPAGKVVLHTTTSFMAEALAQIEPCIRAGKSVVSTCEQLSYPWLKYPKEAEEMDALAKAHGVTVVGTGVNPGFIMDLLPLTLTAPLVGVQRIKVTRIVDAAQRRLPLQRKVGAGLGREEFEDKATRRQLGHMGMEESVGLIAYGLGWKLDKVTAEIEPVIAQERQVTRFVDVLPGQVAGVHQFARGFKNSREVITLELWMYVGAKDTMDATYIEGKPTIEMKIAGGVHGDVATIAMVVNTALALKDARPGLLTVIDLPTIRARES